MLQLILIHVYYIENEIIVIKINSNLWILENFKYT